jgi:hypothetical protein
MDATTQAMTLEEYAAVVEDDERQLGSGRNSSRASIRLWSTRTSGRKSRIAASRSC